MAEREQSRRAGRETRQAVLESARSLFNEHGVDSVSMRAVAAQAGISVGNLTYYFPRKQDLVNALMDEDAAETLVHEPLTGLAQLDAVFGNMLRALRRNPFFFLDDKAQRMAGPAVLENVRRIHMQLEPALDTLAAQGLLRPDFQGTVRQQVMYVLLLTHITWLKISTRSTPVAAMSARELLDAHWTVLSPWLTEAGQAELAALRSRADRDDL